MAFEIWHQTSGIIEKGHIGQSCLDVCVSTEFNYSFLEIGIDGQPFQQRVKGLIPDPRVPPLQRKQRGVEEAEVMGILDCPERRKVGRKDIVYQQKVRVFQ
jgi:hypothetical protein